MLSSCSSLRCDFGCWPRSICFVRTYNSLNLFMIAALFRNAEHMLAIAPWRIFVFLYTSLVSSRCKIFYYCHQIYKTVNQFLTSELLFFTNYVTIFLRHCTVVYQGSWSFYHILDVHTMYIKAWKTTS